MVASPTATFHSSVEQMLVKMRLADRIVVRARHFGALPELAQSTDLLAIVPDAYARNLRERYDLRVWRLPDHTTGTGGGDYPLKWSSYGEILLID